MWERVSSSEKAASFFGERRSTGVFEKLRISSAISSGASTKSARPVLMTLLGMPSKRALSGAWAMTRPSCSFTALMPPVPSLPVPERTTAMAFSLYSSAIELKKMSIGWLSVPGTYSVRMRRPFCTVMYFFGGIRYTVSRSMVMPFSAW